jgi:hypothetical protein
MQVVIGGEPRSLGGFSAYKAFKAMEIIASAEEVYRQVLVESASFRRDFEERNVVEVQRAEARRQFGPQPLMRIFRDQNEEGETVAIRDEPVLDDDGLPMMTPDPLGHLSDADWEASGNKLRLVQSPSEQVSVAAMIPTAFRLGREQALRLLALVLTSNSDLEKWDADGDVDAELDKGAKDLVHRAAADELVRLAVAALDLCKGQIAGPFDELVAAVRTTFAKPEAEEEVETRSPEPMQVETPDSPTSSGESADDSDGTPPSSSTALASASSSSSETG